MPSLDKKKVVELLGQVENARSEISNLELKDGRGGFGKKVWTTISSFANSPEGGFIVYGIEETTQREINIVGGLNIAVLQERFRAFCADEMQNAPIPILDVLEYGGHTLLVAEIRPQPTERKPCYFKPLALPSGACIRVGNTDQVISFEQMKEFVRNSMPFKFDVTKAEGVTIDMLSIESIRRFFQESAERVGRGPVPTEDLQLLKNLGLAGDFQGSTYPTVAGFLIFAKDFPQKYPAFMRYIVRCVRYAGDSVATPIVDKIDIGGTLGEQIDQVHNFIMRNIPLTAKLVGAKRVETYAYPEEAIREIVANAIVHRDYQITETYTQVNIFSNRIEISNAGNLPPGVTINNIKEAQFSRNEIISGTLKDMKYLEEYGRGIDLIYARMKEWDLLEPLFKNTANTFKVTLLGEDFRGLSDNQVAIWHILQNSNETITASRCEGFFPNRSRPSINLDLSKLVEKGLISKMGSGRSTFYRALF